MTAPLRLGVLTLGLGAFGCATVPFGTVTRPDAVAIAKGPIAPVEDRVRVVLHLEPKAFDGYRVWRDGRVAQETSPYLVVADATGRVRLALRPGDHGFVDLPKEHPFLAAWAQEGWLGGEHLASTACVAALETNRAVPGRVYRVRVRATGPLLNQGLMDVDQQCVPLEAVRVPLAEARAFDASLERSLRMTLDTTDAAWPSVLDDARDRLAGKRAQFRQFRQTPEAGPDWSPERSRLVPDDGTGELRPTDAL
jgi:hypothetical protein